MLLHPFDVHEITIPPIFDLKSKGSWFNSGMGSKAAFVWLFYLITRMFG